MEALATTSKLLLETGRAFSSLREYFRDDESFQILAQDLGWDLTELPAPIANLLPVLQQLETSLLALVQDPSLTTLTAARTALTTAYTALQDLAQQTYTFATVDAVAFKNGFPQQVISLTLIDYLDQQHSRIYAVLLGAGLITREIVPATIDRLSYIRKSFNLQALGTLLQQPTDIWKTLYGWGTDFAYNRLALAVTEMLYRLGWDADITNADYNLLTSVNPLPLPVPLPTTKAVYVSLFDRDTDLGALHLSAQLLPVLNAAGNYEGLALAMQALGTLADIIELGNQFELSLTGGASLATGLGVRLQPGQGISINALTTTSATVSGKVEAALQRRPTGIAGTPQLLLRTPGNTELTYETITWKVGALASTAAASDLYTELRINALRFASGDGDNDSFLSQVLKNFNFRTDLSVGLSKVKGFYFDSAGGLQTKQVKNIALGPVQLNNVGFAVATANGFTYLTVVSDVQAKLGPVQVDISRVGIKAGLKYVASGGDIGPFSADIAVKSPDAIGISIKTDAVTGGGFLYFDPANHKYAGAAQLTFKDKINLNALGLLQTELPNNQPGYSLALLITAQFNPIQLGLGFTLNAIGGLVGINRAANVPYLRRLVQEGRQDTLLFPANVLANPQAALATLDNAFPATEDRYVFGLMARIGWGTPNLLTLDAALIIELPAPVRLILLGVLRAVLPDLNTPIIRLRADFLGVVDFGAKKISFDAMLVDSRILQFALTGSLAFRLYQGENPVFLITAGGFHPSFQPPANADLPTLRRITLALAQGGDFRLTLTSYLAITTSTVQFGSRLDLYVGLPSSFYIEGFLSFDALFQFNPFYVQVQIGAGVAIKRNGSAKLTLSLNLLVSGPGPWHVRGEGSFKILFFRIRFTIDRTFGSNTSQPALPATDVRPLLKAALLDSANWEVLPPAVRASSTTVLRADEQPGELLVDPAGALVVRQKVVPLDYPVEVYGNTRPTNGTLFSITSVVLGGTASPVTVSGTALGEVRDAFAPGQFRRMSDGQKLSAPSFQLMRSGLRLDVVDGLVSSTGTVQTTEFELQIISPATGTGAGFTAGSASRAADPSQLVAGTGTPVVITPTVQPLSAELPGELFQRLAGNGAVGRAARSYEQRRPSRKAPDQVLWDEDAYAVVRTRTLQPSPGAPNPFPTEAEATAYVTQQLALNPSLAGELQVVPVYQLDVSAPATASNLATA